MVWPAYVAPGQPIESSWGNAVVDALNQLNDQAKTYVATFRQTGQIYSPGQVAQLNWDFRSTPDWGTGPVLTVPANRGGIYGITATVTGPNPPPDAFNDVVLNLPGGMVFASYVPGGKSLVAVTTIWQLAAGASFSLSCYNSLASSQYFAGDMTLTRVGV